MTEPTRPRPRCIGGECEFTWQAPEPPPSLRRFGTWKIGRVDPDCIEHGYMTRVNVAALLRYGD